MIYFYIKNIKRTSKRYFRWNFRKHAIEKAFFYAEKIGKNKVPNLWPLRQILYSLRRALDTETINDISGYSKNTFSEKIKNWNTKKDILIFINDNYRDIISEFNFLINQSYIFQFGFNKLNILVKKNTSEERIEV